MRRHELGALCRNSAPKSRERRTNLHCYRIALLAIRTPFAEADSDEAHPASLRSELQHGRSGR